MKVCKNCSRKNECADLPGICLKLPRILAASVFVMVAILFYDSSL